MKNKSRKVWARLDNKDYWLPGIIEDGKLHVGFAIDEGFGISAEALEIRRRKKWSACCSNKWKPK